MLWDDIVPIMELLLFLSVSNRTDFIKRDISLNKLAFLLSYIVQLLQGLFTIPTFDILLIYVFLWCM